MRVRVKTQRFLRGKPKRKKPPICLLLWCKLSTHIITSICLWAPTQRRHQPLKIVSTYFPGGTNLLWIYATTCSNHCSTFHTIFKLKIRAITYTKKYKSDSLQYHTSALGPLLFHRNSWPYTVPLAHSAPFIWTFLLAAPSSLLHLLITTLYNTLPQFITWAICSTFACSTPPSLGCTTILYPPLCSIVFLYFVNL